MKLTLNLTYEDGMKVLEAMRGVAAENGWKEDELDECGVVEEYAHVVDAALTAMGIEVLIDSAPSGESDEDEDEDEDEVNHFDFPMDYLPEYDENEDEDENTECDNSCQYSLTAKGDFVLRYMKVGHTFEQAVEIANLLFGTGE